VIEITVAPAFVGGILFRGHEERVLMGIIKINIQQAEHVTFSIHCNLCYSHGLSHADRFTRYTLYIFNSKFNNKCK